MANPLEQFTIKTLIPIPLGEIDASLTNSGLFMILTVAVILLFLTFSMRQKLLVPGRWQSLAEISYEFIAGMIRDNVGSEGRKYFPFVFSLFMFILFGNLLGLIPYAFTFTSHIAVTFAMAIVVFIGVTIIAIARHNMMAGHTMMKVFAGFVIPLGILGGWAPLAVDVALTAFEFLVAFLQAYVFTVLTCLYLNDAIHLH